MTLAEKNLLEAVLENKAAHELAPLRAAVFEERVSPEWRKAAIAVIRIEVDAQYNRRKIWELCPLPIGSRERSDLFSVLWREAGGEI